MSERWVCGQCSKTNRGEAFTCDKCGALRGVDALARAGVDTTSSSGIPPFEDGLSAPPSPPRPRSGKRWVRWLGILWIPVALVGFLLTLGDAKRGDDGHITSAGSISAIDLRVGDCFDHEFDESEENIGTVRAVPCGEPHGYEVFAIHNRGPGAYPTEEQMDGVFVDHCLSAFDTFVGVVYEDSELWVEMLFPTEEGWTNGDRSFTCFLYEPDTMLTGSMRGAGR